jgi:hypothetical protein
MKMLIAINNERGLQTSQLQITKITVSLISDENFPSPRLIKFHKVWHERKKISGRKR